MKELWLRYLRSVSISGVDSVLVNAFIFSQKHLIITKIVETGFQLLYPGSLFKGDGPFSFCFFCLLDRTLHGIKIACVFDP